MADSPRLAITRRLRKTPFTSRVMAQGVKSFTVYNHMLLPTEFASIEEDYWHLCKSVQVWDVSVERQVSLRGPDATRLVQWMTPRDISNISLDRCVYLPLADERGKLINDPVGLRLAEDHWWLSIADSDVMLWAKGLATGANLDVHIEEPDVWPLAVQGPLAEVLMARVFGESVKGIRFFRYARLDFKGHDFIVARSGWSKQGGFEIYVDDLSRGQALYDELFDKGADLEVRPGCPNLIERLESSLLGFGNDMDSRHSVLESGLEDFISLDSDIQSLSVAALRAERDRGLERRIVGVVVAAPEGPRPLAERPFADSSLCGALGGDLGGNLGENLSGKAFPHTSAGNEVGQKMPSGALSDALPDTLPEAVTMQADLGHCLGSQVWSPRHGCQIATAVLEEPLASEQETTVTLSDGTRAQARICPLPFDLSAFKRES